MVFKQGSMENLVITDFWKGKKVLITGHTGFKGSWLSLWLSQLEAEVYGVSLAPESQLALFNLLNLKDELTHHIGDIRDRSLIKDHIRQFNPEVIFHMAAQSLVRRSYREPCLTWETNVLGTINVLEVLREHDKHCSVVIVTTDKVYENLESIRPYKETDKLGGHDPYSSSKAAAELAVSSWNRSYLGKDSPARVATARSGNVIGGGDWSEDRIVPDMIKALAAERPVQVRNPTSIRPWQHVLEPLSGYMRLAEKLTNSDDEAFRGPFNFGPDNTDLQTVENLVEESLQYWPGSWENNAEKNVPHEAGILGLEIEKAHSLLGWKPKLEFTESVRLTLEWYRKVHEGASPIETTMEQIRFYSEL